MSIAAWTLCATWIAAAAAAGALGARQGSREGRWPKAAARLKSPTVYLFTAYLVVAGIATPHEAGESSSPLIGLGVVLPLSYVLATLSSIGHEHRSAPRAIALAALHGGAVFAAAAIVLALASPAYLPGALR